jgi:DNA-directed RNA polymerase subunit RPC12/RpoP
MDDTMSRQSPKAIERMKKIASMSEAEAKEYLRSEKRVEPEEASAGSTAWSGSTADRDIRCKNCSRLFDVMEAEVGDRTLENTLTGLKDINNPWVKCPHCGFTM